MNPHDNDRRAAAAVGTAMSIISAALAGGDHPATDMEMLMLLDEAVAHAEDPKVAREQIFTTLAHLTAGMIAQQCVANRRDPQGVAEDIARTGRLISGGAV